MSKVYAQNNYIHASHNIIHLPSDKDQVKTFLSGIEYFVLAQFDPQSLFSLMILLLQSMRISSCFYKRPHGNYLTKIVLSHIRTV